ncbi:MAG TPA: VOC family protein [Acidimicrobiales bacterium]|nr:VOC family protein [Acidimicrobiales bacterium]
MSPGGEAVGRLSDVILDCPDLDEEARFWSAVLGLEVDESSRDRDWVSLAPAEGGLRLSFQLVSDYRPPQWPEQEVPQQLHLDIAVSDLDSAESRLLRLGARRSRYQPGLEGPNASGTFRVYLDPADHPFCLILDQTVD